jgi:hypothetical protein
VVAFCSVIALRSIPAFVFCDIITPYLNHKKTMPNFFTDNHDIQFLLDYFDLHEVAAIQERETPNGAADYVPRDIDDVIDNYRRVLEIVGEVAAETLAPNADQVDA